MNTVSVDPQTLQLAYQFIDTVAGLGEHQDLLPVLGAQQVQKQLGLALFVDRDDPLLDAAGRHVARADFDAQRVVEHLLGQQADRVRKGRREQQGLTLFRQGAVDITQLFGEAQVEHAVSFVEDQGLQLVELDRFLAIEVQQTARCGHQYINAFAHFHHLRVDADTAVHRVGAQRQVFGVLANAFVNLFGQFAGRHQHQCTHRVAGHFRAFHGQRLQQR